MDSIFHPNSKLMQLGNKLVHLLEADLLMLLCSIPIITIGPAVAAMHYVVLHIYRNEEEYIGKMFWKSFKENLLQGMGLTLVYALVFWGLLYSYYVISSGQMEHSIIWLVVLIFVSVVAVTSCAWAVIFLSRYHDKTGRIIRNSITMLFLKPHYSIAICALSVMPLIAIVFATKLLPLVLALGFSGCAFFQAILYSRVFDVLEGKRHTRQQHGADR